VRYRCLIGEGVKNLALLLLYQTFAKPEGFENPINPKKTPEKQGKNKESRVKNYPSNVKVSV